MSRWKSALLGLAAVSLAACESNGSRGPATAEQRSQFEQFAGPPIESFTYLLHYYTWQPLGQLQLVLWTTINDAYLITVQPPCVGLDFTSRIHLTSAAHTVTRRIDAVTFGDQHCFITQIRPVNYLAMKRQYHTLP